MKWKVIFVILLVIAVGACSHLAETPIEDVDPSLDEDIAEIDSLMEEFDESEIEQLEKDLDDL